MPNRLIRAMLRPDTPESEARNGSQNRSEPASENDVLGDSAGPYPRPDQADDAAENSSRGAAYRQRVRKRRHPPLDAPEPTPSIASLSLPTIVWAMPPPFRPPATVTTPAITAPISRISPTYST